MKRSIYLSFIMGAALLAYGCSSSESEPQKPTPSTAPTTMTLDKTSAQVDPAGGTVTLSVTSPTRPSFSSSEKWATITDGTFKDYKITITVNVAENTAFDSRKATVSVTAGSLSGKLEISQGSKYGEGITLSDTEGSIDGEGGSVTITVTSPKKPTVQSSESWLVAQLGNYANYSAPVVITAAKNTTGAERKATVTFTSDSYKATYTLTQAKYEEPSMNEAQQLARSLALGWNMGNHFDAYYGDWAGEDLADMPDETVWGNPLATSATFQGLKAAGFSSVRIPVSWLRKIGPAPDYAIDEAWMKRVHEVVDMALAQDLYVIVNTHHDENDNQSAYHWLDIKSAAASSERNEAIKAEITAVWTQIANEFKDEGDKLIFESFNEIQDGGWGWSDAFRKNPSIQCDILSSWNQVFVDAVRATGGNNSTRWLGVPTYAASPEWEQYATLPSDPAGKVMLAVHFYDPYDYTLGSSQFSDWGHTGASGRKASGGDEDHVVSVFSNLYNKYIRNNIPVYLGEFGCSMRDRSDTRAWQFYMYYMEYVSKAARTYFLPAFLWDNGVSGYGSEHHGYINHGTGNYMGNSKAVVDILVKGMTDENEFYTLDSVYNSAPQF